MKALAAAFVAAQQEMPAVKPNARNPHFGNDFVSLDHLIASTKPTLTKHGLAILQFPATVEGTPALTTMLLHAESGESMSDTSPLILAKQDMQGLGGALTYMRRYAWASVLGISAEGDDDGNAASAPAAQVSGSAGEQKPAASSPTPSGSAVGARFTYPFGKHKGKTVAEVEEQDPGWHDWFLTNGQKDDIKALINEHRSLAALSETGGTFADDDSIPF